jgi:LCP family protein required for cell wall assembly
MSPNRKALAGFITAALITAACSSTSVPEAETTTPPPPAASTTLPAASPTTTPAETTVPDTAVVVTGDLPDDLLTAIAGVLSWMSDDTEARPDLPEGLVTALEAHPIATTPEMVVEGSTATIEGGRIGVVTTEDGDVLLAADEGDGWMIVGADPVDGPAWYGDEPRMVMVIGSDARPGENQQRLRADSIHLLTANPSDGSGTILGFPRDSYVSTPFGKMKFSSLMAGRGPEVMVDQVVDTWDLPVEGYVVTGFEGFESMMGAIGSLPIDLPRAIPEQKYWPGFRAGRQTLTPQRTLEYARTRKKIPGGDFGRSENQGFVMLAVLDVLQMNDITDTPEIVGVLLDHTWTDLTPTDLIQLAATVHTLDPDRIENVVLPGKLGMESGASIVRLTPEADRMLADLSDDGLLNG